ncbi:MAG: hypothetical protein JXO49_11310 [Deltaproteobacteria bacterium]|nr:hypothetical protein [Candidatus Anaeroferrophillus wilburensis]MBN2889922.1 hypothetical protein [Deltaproteobacteria bacterium]
MTSCRPNGPSVFFGGPQQPGRLRDLLAKHIDQVPAGGAIDWVTYYFRDRRLAAELLAAHRRGVRVTVTVEKQPRTAHANDRVAALLDGPRGLGAGFRSLSLPLLPGSFKASWEPHIHEKLYCFSHPQPVAFMGSYNPSGDQPEECPEIIQEIGDQDRGYNLLVQVTDARLVGLLTAHARRLHRRKESFFQRFSPFNNIALRGHDWQVFFWPRITSHPVMRFLESLPPGSRIRIAISHLKGRSIARRLAGLAVRGMNLEVIADSTLRRVPLSVEAIMDRAGIMFSRLGGLTGLPMHDKFVLVESGEQRWIIFGSFNWTVRSWWLNQEIGLISSNAALYESFAARWEELCAAAEEEND